MHHGENINIENINLMALTATTTLCTRSFIIRSLSMHNPAVVYIPPVKYNLTLWLRKKQLTSTLKPFVEKPRNVEV